MELGEAEAFGALDHHDGGVGDVDANLDHRGGDEDAGFAGDESRHGGVLVGRRHLAVDKTHLAVAKRGAEALEAFFGCRHVDRFAFLDQRADPVGLAAFQDRLAQVVDHLVDPARGDQRGLDGFPAGRFFVEDRDVHMAVLGEAEGAGDGRGRHHEDVGLGAFRAELHPLRHAEAVLFVDDGEAEIVELHPLLEDGVGADQDLDIAPGQRREFRVALRALVAARQDLHHHPGGFGEGLKAFEVLAGKDFRGGHEDPLPVVLDRRQEGEEGDEGFSGPHVALEETVHPVGGGHVGVDVAGRKLLRARGPVRERCEDLVAEPAGARGRPPGRAAVGGAGDGQGDLVGEKLIIGEALAGGRRWRRGLPAARGRGRPPARPARRASPRAGKVRGRSIRGGRGRGQARRQRPCP